MSILPSCAFDSMLARGWEEYGKKKANVEIYTCWSTMREWVQLCWKHCRSPKVQTAEKACCTSVGSAVFPSCCALDDHSCGSARALRSGVAWSTSEISRWEELNHELYSACDKERQISTSFLTALSSSPPVVFVYAVVQAPRPPQPLQAQHHLCCCALSCLSLTFTLFFEVHRAVAQRHLNREDARALVYRSAEHYL